MKRIAVVTENVFLFRKIKLALLGRAECRMTDGSGVWHDLVLADLDTCANPPVGAVLMSRERECDLKIPFLISELLALTEGGGKKTARLLTDSIERAAVLDGKVLKLTELEFKLLSLLTSEMRYFTKAEILDFVWQGAKDEGIVNVYVHYLREKLEEGDEKIILSSRGKGYKINEKFLCEEDFKLC